MKIEILYLGKQRDKRKQDAGKNLVFREREVRAELRQKKLQPKKQNTKSMLK